jgi:arsenate reductase
MAGLLRIAWGPLPAYSGTDPRCSPDAQVLQELGIDTSRCGPSVSEYLGRLRTHYVIVVCRQARNLPLKIRSGFWPFDDPPEFRGAADEQLREFRRVRDQIDQRIQDWLKKIDMERNAAIIGG